MGNATSLRRGLLFFCVVIFGCANSFGQVVATNPSSAPPRQEAKRPLSIDDVIRMSEAGLSDDVIIQQIKKRPQPFDLTPNQLIQLKSARVTDSVIRAMIGAASTDTSKSGTESAAPPGIEQQLWGKAMKGDPAAQFNLSRLYYDGKATPQDYAEAAAWMMKAAEQGYVAAEFGLAIMYENGQGLAQDQSQAVAWYSKAAERGNPAAQFNLALKYIDGKGVPQSYLEAATWLKRAADQGYAPAQYGLGLAYGYGLGVPQDDNMSATWLRRAAAQGNADAQKALDSIQQRTTSLPASHYQTAILEGWKTAAHGSHCESTARATSNYDGTVDANGSTDCADATFRVYSVLVGDYRYQVTPDRSVLASMPVVFLAFAFKESPLAKFGPGARIEVRTEGKSMYVPYKGGKKEWKYSIIATSPK